MTILGCLTLEAEEYLREVYSLLVTLLSKEKMKQLLLQESDSLMRPIEMAANNGTLGLFQDLFETNGVYLTSTYISGVYTKEFYNITEYESVHGERYQHIILAYLSAMDETCLNSKYIYELFEKEYIKEWIRNKYRKNIPIIIVWLIIRLIYASAYIIFDNSATINEEKITVFKDPEHVNNTNESCLSRSWQPKTSNYTVILAIGIYLLAHSVIAISNDFFEWFKICTMMIQHKKLHKERMETPRGKKKPVSNYFTLWLIQFTMYLFVIGSVTVRLLRYNFDIGISLVANNLVNIIILGNILASLLYFLQLVPHVGTYAVMTIKVGNNVLKYFCIMLMFTTFGFFLIIPKIINFGKLTCDENFQSFWHSAYSVFLMTFTMLDFRNADVPQEQLALLFSVHNIFLVIVGIMLFNFFIALYTYSVTEFMKFGNVFTSIEMITLLNVSEFRLSRMFKGWLREHEKNCFETDDEGNLYVTRTIFVKKENYSK